MTFVQLPILGKIECYYFFMWNKANIEEMPKNNAGGKFLL